MDDHRDIEIVVVLRVRARGAAAPILDALAGMQLAARRCGGRIRLRRADPALLALLELAGLTDVLIGHVGEPEDGEQTGV